jgi:5-methylcytosine-specific restriction endonuclease McrA
LYKPTLATKLKQRASHLKRVAMGLHNNYKGGVEKENAKARKSLEYREWREAVFKRDDYTCQACGKTGCYIEADHVMSFSEYPDLRYEALNGRTLCKPCHREVTKKQMKVIWKNQYER